MAQPKWNENQTVLAAAIHTPDRNTGPLEGAAAGSWTLGQTRLSDFTFTLHFHALEKEMATHSGVLA